MIADSIAVSPVFDTLDNLGSTDLSKPFLAHFRPLTDHAGEPSPTSPASFHSEDSIFASLDAITSQRDPEPRPRPSPTTFVQIAFQQAQKLQSASASLLQAIDGL